MIISVKCSCLWCEKFIFCNKNCIVLYCIVKTEYCNIIQKKINYLNGLIYFSTLKLLYLKSPVMDWPSVQCFFVFGPIWLDRL